MTEKKPIGEVIEDFARSIIEEAQTEDIALKDRITAFQVLTNYFVGIHKVGAESKGGAVVKTFEDMKKEISHERVPDSK
jgi:hypothetical protein